MNTHNFTDQLSHLNSNQRLAVDTIEGPVMVIAGPGTGKTQTLTLRIANILRTVQVNPENILALTFTDSAVYEMRQRLISVIGNDAYRVGIYTFHSFSDAIIKRYNDEFEDLLAATSISELQQIQIVEKILTNNTYKLLKPLSTPLFHAKTIVREINTLKRERVSAEKLALATKRDQEDFDSTENKIHEKGRYKGKMKGEYQKWEKRILKNFELVSLFEKYEEHLKQHNQYDFNDMILKVVALLEHKTDLLLQIQERYQYILVDEHQDTNTAQNKLIELLGSYYDVPNLFIVGDEKQAIFRFQGASLENFLYFKERYPSATLINLQNNYRSSQTILDASMSLIEHSSIPLPSLETRLTSVSKRDNKPIQVAQLDNYFSEFAFIASDIKLRQEGGESLKQIAVISRTNRDLFELARFLELQSIPFSIESDQNVLQDPTIEKLILLLRSVATLPDDELLAKVMHLDFLNLYAIDLYRIIRLARELRIPLWECLEKQLDNELLLLQNTQAFKDFFQSMITWQTYIHNNRLDDALIKILTESGYLNYLLQQPNSFDCLDKLTRLFQEIRIHVYDDPSFTLIQFLSYLDLLQEHSLSLKVRHIASNREAVQLMTAHKAKGREYNHVYITQAFDGHWGSSKTKGSLFTIPWNHLGVSRTPQELDTEMDDERRLFYVALTRARHTLTITFASHGLEGKEQTVSQFVEEIVPTHRVSVDTSQFNATFQQNQAEIFRIVPSTTIERLFIDNLPYFQERLQRKGISVTDLNNFLVCPWRYFFRNLIQIPEAKANAQMYGTAIHSALNRFIEGRKNGKTTEMDLLSRFKEAIEQQPFGESDKADWYERGQKALSGFYNERVVTWHNLIESELTIPGVVFKENIFLTGTIDMIEVTSTKNDVVVYDFKTGSPKSRNFIEGKVGKSIGEYKRQLVFYKILLDTFKNGFYRMNSGIIEFIEPTESGSYRHEAFEITNEDQDEVRNEITQLHEEVFEMKFWNTFCDDQDCPYCKLRRSMSGA